MTTTERRLKPRTSPESQPRIGFTGASKKFCPSSFVFHPQSLLVDPLGNTPTNAAPTDRKRKSHVPSAPSRRSSRLSSEQSTPGRGTDVPPEFTTQSDQVTGQPPPPSPLAASQRPFRIQLSRAKRNLHGAGPRAIGSLYFLQIFTAFLQSIGEQYSATGQDQSSSLRLMTKCPLRAGKPFRQHWTGINPQRHSYVGTGLAEQIR